MVLDLNLQRRSSLLRGSPSRLRTNSVHTIHLIFILIVVLVTPLSQANTEFAEYPSNVTVNAGSEDGAVFRCRHTSINAFINWLIDGLPSNNDPNVLPVPINESGIIVNALTVPATSEYNGTQVVCVAFTSNGREETPPVMLTVIEEITTSPPPIMTTATTERPNPISNANFIEVPSPPVVVVPLFGAYNTYQYRCRHSETNRTFWIIDGTRLVDIVPQPPSISTSTLLLPSGDLVSTLTIGGLPQHNGTTIQCLAESQDQLSTAVTPNAMFLIQGPPQSVSDLQRNGNTIIWEAPFSLNLTNIEPDVVYCVEVYNITCGRSHMISDCDVMESRYTNDDLQSGYIYEYTITPRSNAQGALNGTDLKISESFMELQLPLMDRNFKISITDDNSSIVSASAYFSIINLDAQGLVFAARHFLSLTPLDFVEENGSSLLVPTDTTRNGNSVKIETSLPFRRRFNCIVLAHGCDQHPVTETTEISTHDIQNISVTSTQPASIRITGDFIRGSSAIGVLAIIVPLESESNVIYSFRPRQNTTALRAEDVSLPGGHYSVSLFVVEEEGDVFSRTTSSPIDVSVDSGMRSTQSLISYSVQSTSTGVCITCTFLESSTTDCVAVVHQRISQLNPSGLMNIESSHKFTRSGDTASGCIEGVNLEDYQVGVIGVNTEVVITDPPTVGGEGDGEIAVQACDGLCGGIAGLVIVLFLCAIVVLAVTIVLLRRRWQSRKLQLVMAGTSESNPYSAVFPYRSVEPDPEEGTETTEAKSSGYADIDNFTSNENKPLPEKDRVIYDDIQGYNNPEGNHYTLIGAGEPGKKPDEDTTLVVYSELKPPETVETSQQQGDEEEKESGESSLTKQDLACLSSTPFDMEHLLPEVMGVASKWQSLGKALSLDEDILDEIYTNNETDEDCLRDMLERYLLRNDVSHSWEEIETALSRVREHVEKSEFEEVVRTVELDNEVLVPQEERQEMWLHQNDNDYISGFEEETIACSTESCSLTEVGQFQSGQNQPISVEDGQSTTVVAEEEDAERSCSTICWQESLEHSSPLHSFTSSYIYESCAPRSERRNACVDTSSRNEHFISSGLRRRK